MSCNKPLLGLPNEFMPDGSPKKGTTYKIIGSYSREVAEDHPGAIKVPCGKCRGCRLDRCRSWADRMIFELDHSKKAVFLTLTYDDEHVPAFLNMETGEINLTLQQRDFQNFMKRLRKQFKDKDLRYYAVGEYG